MKQEYVNPFLMSAQAVWQKEFGCALRIKDAEAVSHRYQAEETTVIIGISGNLEGSVMYGFPEDLVTEIAGRIVEDESGGAKQLATLSDLAKMVTDDAAAQLVDGGYPCDISPPILLEPAGATLTAGVAKQIQVTFECEMGLMHVRIGLAEEVKEEAEEPAEDEIDLLADDDAEIEGDEEDLEQEEDAA